MARTIRIRRFAGPEVDVELKCPKCGCENFELEMTGYAYYYVSLDTSMTTEMRDARVEGDSETGDDYEPSDMGWMCQQCSDWVTSMKDVDQQVLDDLNQALFDFHDIAQVQYDPAQMVARVLNGIVQIKGD